ncbi:MAG: type II secretion system F family protein [Nitrososphaerales archaeon]
MTKFGTLSKLIERYDKLMVKARIPISGDEYLRKTFLYSFIIALIAIPSLYFLLSYFKIPLFLQLILIALIALLTPILFIIKPYYIITFRRSRIDYNLHHACALLYAVTKAGIQPLEAFQYLVEHKHIYREVAEEFEIAIKRVKYLGENLYSALQYVGSTTSSKRLKEFIEGFIVKTRQSLTIEAYFQKKFEEFFELERTSRESIVKIFSLFGELAIILTALTPTLMLTVGLSLGIINPDILHWCNIYMILATPIFTSLTLISMRAFCPLDEVVSVTKFTHQLPLIGNIPLKIGKSNVSEKNFMIKEKLFMLKHAFKKPLVLFFLYPWVILLISLIILVIVINFLYITNHNLNALLTYTILGLLIIGTIFHEVRFRYVMSIERRTPDFLKSLVETLKMGGSIINAINTIIESGFGLLKREIKDVKATKFGLPLKRSLIIIEYRTASLILKRVLSLLIKAFESTRDLKDILLMAAEDAETYIKLRRERALNLLGYVISLYICFTVYLYVHSILKNEFLTTLTTVKGFVISESIKILLIESYYVAIFLSIMLGLMAGIMLEGNILSGLKHSLIMISILIFWLGVIP